MADKPVTVFRDGPQEKDKYTSPIARAGDERVSWSCWYNGKEYSNGALLCQAGELFQCSYGVWVDQQKKCPPDDVDP